MSALRVAVIGCGAVAESHHLPALAASSQVTVPLLADACAPRARQLADRYGIAVAADDYRSAIGSVDAAIVAVPNSLHASVAIDLLQHGIHVLVEKPMALSVAECDAMIRAASASRCVLAVGLEFRYFYPSQFVKEVVEQGILGNILGFDLRQGLVLSWPFKSDYLLRKDKAGGGVLADFGAHMLDLLLWWLGDHAQVAYYDDAVGGVEADCSLELQFKSGATGTVEISRIRTLRNSCIIRGERGRLEVATWDPNGQVLLTVKGRDLSLVGRVASGRLVHDHMSSVFRRQLDDFVDAIRDRRAPFVPGAEARRSVALIEACYASRQLRLPPWMLPEGAVLPDAAVLQSR